MAAIATRCAALVLPAALAVALQAQALPAVTTADHPRTVFVPDFRHDQPSAFGDLGAIAATQVALRLSELRDIRVMRQEPQTGCTGQPSASFPDQRPYKGETPVAQVQAFYTVRGSLRSVSTEKEGMVQVSLDYELSKTERCRSSIILYRSAVFAQADALAYLSSMADNLADGLDQDVHPRFIVDLDKFEVTGAGQTETAKEKAVRDELLRYVLFRLNREDNLRPREVGGESNTPRGNYWVQGSLKFSPAPGAPPDSPATRVVMSFSVESRDGYRYSGDGLEGSVERPSDFYLKAAQAVLDVIGYAIYAPGAGLSDRPTPEQISAALSKARESLCSGPQTDPDCTPNPRTAIGILKALTLRDSANFNALHLLGVTQSGTGNYLEAARTFDHALALTDRAAPADRVRLLNQSGDNWYATQDYAKAAERYSESIAMNKSQLDIHLRRAQSLRLGGNRLASLDEILESLTVFPSAASLGKELETLSADLRGRELAEGVKRLEAARDRLPDPNLLARAHTRLGQELYAASQTRKDILAAQGQFEAAASLNLTYGKLIVETCGSLAAVAHSLGDFQAMDKPLKRAEAAISASSPDTMKGWLSRLRALWYRDYLKDYEHAERLLIQATKLERSVQGRLQLAQTYILWAGSLARDGSQHANIIYYAKAQEYLMDLVKERETAADASLRDLNHVRGRDNDTRKIFEQIIAKRPGDLSAILMLMFTCTEYLHDFNCALSNARLLEKAAIPPDRPSLYFDISEIEVLTGAYEPASKRLAEIMNMTGLAISLQAVGNFYRLWSSLAQGKAEQAREAFDQWRDAVSQMRAANETIGWVFDGARNSLQTGRSFPGKKRKEKTLLLSMISAMENNTQALPSGVLRQN
jgi:hypothetical protein